jgi:hypothetical protein
MGKNVFFSILVTAFLLISSTYLSAQMEFRYLTGWGTALRDINSSGQAVTAGTVFDFATSTQTPMDSVVLELYNINDNGDLTGAMELDVEGTIIMQPAYKIGDTWLTTGYFPGFNSYANFSIGQISENGTYVAGQMSPDAATIFDAFLYNTSTMVLERIADPANEYSAGYTVNDQGIIGGWYDPQPMGTLRVPAYMTAGPVVTPVMEALPTESTSNQVSAINNSNIMVGDRDNKPFIFDLTTETFTEFEIPDGYESATFTSVSENGIAVGFCQIWTPEGPDREAIVYHPSLGFQPVFIKDILEDNGVSITTADGKLGTAIAISPDGNYVCGWENGQYMFASGWAVNFNDLLTSTCYIECPEDIEIIDLSGSAVVEYSLTISCDENPNAAIVFVSGLESGSVFPLGTTEVVHYLTDGDGATVLNTCSFTVTIIDEYCNPSNIYNYAEPITLVEVAGINNPSSELATVDYEDFTNIAGNVAIGHTYTATFKGYTGGDFTDYFRVFADWDQDGYFDGTNEIYDMGTITNSTGTDAKYTSGELTVPNDALPGQTTMRVIKNWESYTTSPCKITSGIGQIEDYKLNVSSVVNIDKIENETFCIYPNPTNDELNILSDDGTKIVYVELINANGTLVITQKSGQDNLININMRGLNPGIYMLRIVSEDGMESRPIIKQ